VQTPEQWPRIKEIVGAALEREPSERSAFLDQGCSHDGELRAEVESLLAAHADAGALSESPWGTTVADAGGESRGDHRCGNYSTASTAPGVDDTLHRPRLPGGKISLYLVAA
jgi:hypothetical protein